MSITLKPGARLFSRVCTTEMIAVRAPGAEVDLTIGGASPALSENERDLSGSVVEGHGGGAATGKRFVDESETIELLCTKSGEGVPAVNGERLRLKTPKAAPSSD